MGYGKSVRYLTGQVKFYTHQSLGDIIEQRRGCIQIAHHSKIAYFLHRFYSNKEFKIGKTNFKNIKESCLIKNRIMSVRKQNTKVKAKINQKTNQEIWIKTNKLGKKPKLLRSNFIYYVSFHMINNNKVYIIQYLSRNSLQPTKQHLLYRVNT